jgi:hypothetical protein
VRQPSLRSSTRLALGTALLLNACGGGDDTAPPTAPDLGPPPPPAAFASPNVAYEGQQRFVTTLTAPGLDLSGATVTAIATDGPLEVMETRCSASRCGVHVRIRDTRSNAEVPDPVPAPISNRNEFLELRIGSQVRRAVITVWPTQQLNGAGMASLRDALLASGGMVDATGTYVGAPIGGPVRWFSMGPLRFAGTLDVSGPGSLARVGGAAGGAAGSAGMGPGGGAAGVGGAGGGGGGHATPGSPGAGADGTAGAGGVGGAAYGDANTSCLEDARAGVCGGSGGGGAAGEGGAGGGSLLIVSLEGLDFTGATLLARGGAGTSGGGGGSGGNILLAAPTWMPPSTLDVAGGEGEGAGGDGAPGHLRVDVGAGEGWTAAFAGPRLDPSSAPLFGGETVTLRGRAAPGGRVHVERQDDGRRTSGTADPEGTFAIDVPLAPGSNRLRIIEDTDSGPVRGWIGNAFEFGTGARCVTASVCIPIGAFVDIVRVD